MRGTDLLGHEHEHSFTTPYRGYVMCNSKFCGKLVTADGRELTVEELLSLTTELRAEYGA